MVTGELSTGDCCLLVSLMDDELVLIPLINSLDAGDADDPTAGTCKFFIKFRCGFCDGKPLSKLPSVTTGPKCPPSLVPSTINGELVVVVVVVVDVPLRSGVDGIIIVGRTLGPSDEDDEDDSGDDTTVGIPVIDGGLIWLNLEVKFTLTNGCIGCFASFDEPNLKLDDEEAVELGEIH